MTEEFSSAKDRSCMESLQLAGRIILENGGETYRAEETICRMGQGFGLSEVESFAVPSGLFISYRQPDGTLETGVKRVHREGTNLTRIDRVNSVSRKVADGRMNAEEALGELERIRTERGPLKAGLLVPAAALCAGGFALLFGGGWREILFSGIAAAVVQALSLLSRRLRIQWLSTTIFGGFIAALIPHLFARYVPGVSVEIMTAGAVMPLVPGLAMTSAVEDAMRGDMISGISHGAQAVLTACLIAGGALLANAVMRVLEGGILP